MLDIEIVDARIRSELRFSRTIQSNYSNCLKQRSRLKQSCELQATQESASCAIHAISSESPLVGGLSRAIRYRGSVGAAIVKSRPASMRRNSRRVLAFGQLCDPAAPASRVSTWERRIMMRERPIIVSERDARQLRALLRYRPESSFRDQAHCAS